MPAKSLKQIILRKKNWRDSSLGYVKLIVRWNSFLSLDLLFMCCFKRSFGFLQTKAYKSKTKINFSNFFWYFKKRSIHVPPKKKSTLYLYSKCAFLQQNWKALYFVLCWTISWSKIGASWWIFSKNVPQNTTWKWECRPWT